MDGIVDTQLRLEADAARGLRLSLLARIGCAFEQGRRVAVVAGGARTFAARSAATDGSNEP